MNMEPIVALDCMGGDGGPATVLAGAATARERYPRLRFRLFGDHARIAPELERLRGLAAAADVVHTDGEVLATDKPSHALRRGRDSSMGRAIMEVREGRAHVAVSAGNTGALMAMAKLMLRTQEGIDRPALAALLPTAKADVVMLDLGANVESSAENLVQFAVMGAAFARIVLGLKRPRVALLNIGEEELKGTEELRDAAAMLRQAGGDLPLQFVGFAEGDKLVRGDLDVVVSDGFSGNVALKAAEGTARLVVELLGRAFRSTLLSQLGFLLASKQLKSLRAHVDPNNHNGAVFLGLGGLVVKSHGGANAKGLANAIGVAHDLVVDDIGGRIAHDMRFFQAHRTLGAPASAPPRSGDEAAA
jgi:glycerol-3-phosphate acyltransferase PlsX